MQWQRRSLTLFALGQIIEKGVAWFIVCCCSCSSEKYKKAKRFGIPCVTEKWLDVAIHNGRKHKRFPDPADYDPGMLRSYFEIGVHLENGNCVFARVIDIPLIVR
jgi:hypothetical protein